MPELQRDRLGVRVVHRPRAVEAGMPSRVGEQREDLARRRLDDAFDADGVSVHRFIIRLCRATMRQRPSLTSTRPAMARTRGPRVYVANTSAAAAWCGSRSSTAAVRSRTRRNTAALSGPAVLASVKTMSSSGGVSIGRSCAIGLRRSITSNTRRSAASANFAAPEAAQLGRRPVDGPQRSPGCAVQCGRASAPGTETAVRRRHRRAVVRSRRPAR